LQLALILVVITNPSSPYRCYAHPIGPIIKDKYIVSYASDETFSQNHAYLRHIFYPNGTVVILDELGASLMIEGLELPFAHSTELLNYRNGTIAYKLFFRCLGRIYEIWEVFDFEARTDGVKITILGVLPTPSNIKIPLRAGNGSLVEYDSYLKIFWCVRLNDLGEKFGRVGFDWKDMESIASFSPSTNTITVNVSEIFLIDPSTVGTSTTNTATQWSFQRKSFYANGRFWVFYSA